MTKWLDALLLVGGVVVLAFVVAFASSLSLVSGAVNLPEEAEESVPRPPDAELRATFAQRRADLERLRAKILTEPADRSRIDADAPLTKENLEYLRLLSSIGARSIVRGHGLVELNVYAAGLVTSGSSKSFVWMENRPSPVVDDTDRDRPMGMYESYAELGEGWYIEETSN